MNDKEQKDKLDAGKAGSHQRLWSSISDEYNNSENDEVYGVFRFVEDEQLGELAKEFDVTTYNKLKLLPGSRQSSATMNLLVHQVRQTPAWLLWVLPEETSDVLLPIVRWVET
jgi:hypothetical protein